MRDRLAMYSGNALKLGLFGVNCSSGRSATKVPERWSASWADCLALSRMAEDAGIDFMLPVGRWKGYGGDTDMHGETLETITWATGLLAATSRITVFGTVHAPLFHPIIAAKQCVTPIMSAAAASASTSSPAGTRASSRCSVSSSASTRRATTMPRNGSTRSSWPGVRRTISISRARISS
jgi:hypothetical protein